MLNHRLTTLAALAAAVAALGLAGCDKSQRDSARSAADDTVAQVDQKARQIGNDVKSGAQRMGDKLDDAAITASVKTDIAKDADLSAMSISVDTSNGQVTLRGSAPSAAAKDHATMLARGVDGVTSVDNQLSVDPSKK